jgi:exodeoxyribonuclease VII small subunit
MKTNQMTYRQAMGELKAIVDRLRDGEDVDVDELVVDVGRAKELIDFCGAKVKKADTAIKGIVSELQTADETTLAVATSGSASRNGDGAEEIPF